MSSKHRVQLLVCHEAVGIRLRDRFDRGQWCNLKAYAWCFEDDYYVCNIHMQSRHEGHNLAIEFPQNRAHVKTQTGRMTERTDD